MAYAVIKKRFAFLSVDHADDSVRKSVMEVADFYAGDIDVAMFASLTNGCNGTLS
jgi:hypothetical protein